jgi:hypothetical protein
VLITVFQIGIWRGARSFQIDPVLRSEVKTSNNSQEIKSRKEKFKNQWLFLVKT